jgi:hypothetical protein
MISESAAGAGGFAEQSVSGYSLRPPERNAIGWRPTWWTGWTVYDDHLMGQVIRAGDWFLPS